VEGPFAVLPSAELSLSKRAAVPSCKVPAQAGTGVENLVSWLGAPGSDSQPPSGPAVDAPAAPLSKIVAGAAHGHGGSAQEGPPGGSTPGPEPGGASGATATGAAGVALSSLLTIAALLLVGPSRAMRRLRLVAEPWRTTSFVLIPERPD
jgi:hypothetical protein